MVWFSNSTVDETFRRPKKAWASVAILVLFAGAMTVSFGIKAPLNYSVLVDAAAPFALIAWPVTLNARSAPQPRS